jgi:imidazolonepropionase-like amidohydrolase
MRRTATLVGMAFALGCGAEGPSEILIDNVTVVDVETGELLPGMSVRTREGRIESVEPAATRDEPGDALVVDGAGTFAIPGLWDMHVHALNTPGLSQLFLTLFVANGITGFRDTWGSLDVARQMEALAADDGFPVPRFVMAGNLVDGPDPVWPTSIVADTPDRGRAIVDSLVSAGAGFIKVYSKLAPEVYHAIAARANELGVPFAGHVPARVSVREAAAAGQRTMEHLYGVVAGCSTEHEALVTEFDEWAKQADRGETTEPYGALGNRLLAEALDTQPVDGCGDLFATFASHHTWQVPTLVTLRGVRHMGDPDFRQDPRLEFVPSAIRSFWNPGNETYANFASETQTRAMARERELVGMMAAAGVPMLAGSDTPNPYAFPGFGLHDELSLFVESGLSPLDALRAATIRPAEFLGATDSLGTVGVGKVADFVLLDGNPLENIANVRKIRGVMLQGRYFDRDALDAMLEEAKSFSRGG